MIWTEGGFIIHATSTGEKDLDIKFVHRRKLIIKTLFPESFKTLLQIKEGGSGSLSGETLVV